jgi:hypothetical protein
MTTHSLDEATSGSTFRSANALFGALISGATISFVSGALVALALGVAGVPRPAPFAALLVVGALAAAHFVPRAARCAFLIGEDGVVVHGAFFSRSISWDDIEAFGWVVGAVPPLVTDVVATSRQLAVKLKDGTIARAAATHGLSADRRAMLVWTVNKHASPRSIPVHVDAEDLRGFWGMSPRRSAHPRLDRS